MKCIYFFSLVFISILFFSCGDENKKQDPNHKFTNALIDETSPYLLQHAHNPVDWKPWSQDALDQAKKENKLVLVSIGYSSCHWCHVMEEETFEDEEIAKMMNENFVSIKVDREERPDVDQVYMTALQLLQGNGGWPLNVITLPNGKPLYGGTYHTKEQWNKVLLDVSRLYNENPEKANEYADRLAEGIQEVNLIQPVTDFEELTQEVLATSVSLWKSAWDEEWGGNTGREKFMLPSNLDFLLDYAVLTNDTATKEYVALTLDKMALGGVYDHVGGGFFRYSTDSFWKVPHFEKMLYDNAQLISLYSKAYKLFKKPMYKKVVLETIAFLEREMKRAEGGYYAAIDADSEGEEGKYYVWTKEELQQLLGEDYELFAAYYTITEAEVWEHGNYVLHRSLDDASFIKNHKFTVSDLEAMKKRSVNALLKARESRIRPRTDDKILSSWNALLINGYADAYKAFGNPEFLERAEAIFDFLKTESFKNNILIHSYKEGGRRTEGFLEDYAFLVNASLNLYGTTLSEKYLVFAQNLHQKTRAEFADKTSGMYRYNKGNSLISKIIKTDDGVLPSPNAVMAHNLFQLGHINYDKDALKEAKSMLSSMISSVKENPANYARWEKLLLHTTYPYFEMAVVGQKAPGIMKDLNARHIPNTLIVGSTQDSDLPLFKNRFDAEDTYIYVCQNSTCKLPVNTIDEAMRQLQNF
ncbi:thioredoxin domain-containing protein [Spongiimicrobium salis]|uniref:thioredoxin domain-containing protein n=1 Tax=Spongiimicrobium salis TaxID=1667022 RepID=UPI00374CA581